MIHPSKRPSSGQSFLSKNAKERVENVKSLGFYSCLFLVPKPHQKVEVSDRLKQAQHLSTGRKVQNGNPRIHQGLSGSRGMGVIHRLVGHLPPHPHPPKLKEVPKVLPLVQGVPVHPSPIWSGHGPPGVYNDCDTDGPHKENQTSSIPGRLTDQGPISERSTNEHSDCGRPESVLRVDNKPGKLQT